MNVNGTFRRKKGFTIVGNMATRDKTLSLKAKGLYLLISSYITMATLELSKEFIIEQCSEGRKAFGTAWDELKEKGYLKVYLQSKGKTWKQEYELLDTPQIGAHTFYLNSKGDITKTNVDRKLGKEGNKQHYPQNGSNADGGNANGCNANGGNNIKPLNNTKDNTIKNNLSINQNEKKTTIDGMTDDDSLVIKSELIKNNGIPDSYCLTPHKSKKAIHLMTDWQTYKEFAGYDDVQQTIHNLVVEALNEMITDPIVQKYGSYSVSRQEVVHKLNEVYRQVDAILPVHFFIERIMEDYISKVSETEIKNPKKYVKTCIWNGFDTYKAIWHAFCVRNQNAYIKKIISKGGKSYENRKKIF